MEEITVLEHEDATALGDHVYAFSHVPRIKCGRAALERFLASFALRIVEIEMQSIVRSLAMIGCFIGTIAMGCAVRTSLSSQSSTTYP
jgi:hypothetical protein